jgi:hypothetical protein
VGPQHDPAQEFAEHLVDQPQRHRWSMPGFRQRRSSRSEEVSAVSGTHTLKTRMAGPSLCRTVRPERDISFRRRGARCCRPWPGRG